MLAGRGEVHCSEKSALLALRTDTQYVSVNAFRTKTGQAVARRGMRRWRTEEEVQTIIVFAGDYYPIFDIEEVFILLGVIPAAWLRADPATVRRKYGLPPAT